MIRNCSDSSITIASWIRRLSLSLLLVGGLSGPSWSQEVNTAEIIATPRADKDRGRVTLRVKVKDANNRPVVGLQEQDFTLKICQPQSEENSDACKMIARGDILDWKNPKEAEPPPAWIIVLLDVSGSMRREDSSGTVKLARALQAIKKFNQNLARRPGETKISIVPFSRGGKNCAGNRVTSLELDNFEDAGNIGEKYLQDLGSQSDSLCGATDIYEPVRQAVRFLGNRTDPRFNPPEDSNEPDPRLSIVLLSDGYHSIYHGEANEVELEQKNFEDLLNLLKKYPEITIHTSGYGLTPQQLQAKYGLSREQTIADVGKVEAEDFTNFERLAKIREEFVDLKRLQEIAGATGARADVGTVWSQEVNTAEIIGKRLQEIAGATGAIADVGTARGQEVNTAEIIGTPRVDKDRGRVTLRVKVKDANNRPVRGLQEQDFTLKICQPQGESNNNACQPLDPREILDFKNPKEAEPPPAWIIFLLDFSGSMNRSDSRGTVKLAGALQAIKEFNRKLARRAGETKIAIVPFSKGGKDCAGNRVTSLELDNFEDASKIGLEKYLQELASQSDSLCGATDIYGPVRKAVRFLGNRRDVRFNPPEDSNEPEPKLWIVLLSDGYHSIYHDEENEPELEEEEFEDLLNLLKNYPQIPIHTFGYGKKPKELQEEFNLPRLPTIRDIGTGSGKVPQEKYDNLERLEQLAAEELVNLRKEFVDEKRLQEMAGATGGISEFGSNEEDIAENFTKLLDVLLGEYEISYIQPQNNADRGSEHNVTVEVKTAENTVASEAKTYVFPWVGPALPASRRRQILLSVLGLFATFGVVPFALWAMRMKGSQGR